MEEVEVRPAEVVIAQAMAEPDRALSLMVPWASEGGLLVLPASERATPPRTPAGWGDARLALGCGESIHSLNVLMLNRQREQSNPDSAAVGWVSLTHDITKEHIARFIGSASNQLFSAPTTITAG